MAQIELDIHGSGASEALTDLILYKELTVQAKPPAASQKNTLDMHAVGTLIGIIGGSSGAADLLLNWYQAWQKGRGNKTVDQVFLITMDRTQVLLEDLSGEELVEILEVVEKA